MARTRPVFVVVPANSRIHEPSVKDKATIAAVALDSVKAAARKATPAITNAYSMWPSRAVATSGRYRWPPSSKPHTARADSVGISAMSQPTPSAATLMATSRLGPTGSCSTSFRAPVCLPLPINLIATNGSRKVFIRYTAPSVGAMIPSSGLRLAASWGSLSAFELVSL